MRELLTHAKTILVFAAHGDDEIIGCGGTIVQLAERGARVIVVTFTNRETAYARVEDKPRAAQNARHEMKAADDILGVAERLVFGLPNQGVENSRENFQTVTKLIRKYRPEVIMTHCPDDHHRDHRAVSALVDEARWKAAENLSPDWGELHKTIAVLHFEIMGNKISRPHLVVTFGKETLDKKITAMQAQASQLEVLPGIEQQIRGAAMDRGGYVGGTGAYGEAFKISDFYPTEVAL